MNKISVYIGGVDYSDYVVSPLKMGNLLDEQLDEVNLTLRYINKEYFEPQTLVRIIISNVPEASYDEDMKAEILGNSDYSFTGSSLNSDDGHLYCAVSRGELTQRYEKYFIVASDNAAERPVGSGRFEHEIYLIERTKILEGFIGDSLTFTNPTATVYGEPKSSFYSWYGYDIEDTPDALKDASETNITGTNYFKSPAQNKTIAIAGLLTNAGFGKTLIDKINANWHGATRALPNAVYDFGETSPEFTLAAGKIFQSVVCKSGNTEVYNSTIRVVNVDGIFKLNRVTVLNGKEIENVTDDKLMLDDYSLLDLSPNVYSVEYSFYAATQQASGVFTTPFWCLKATNIFIVVPEKGNSIAPKRLTISDVVDRIFDTLEPTRAANRFSFDTTQKAKYDNILAPEFSFTKMTVREMLRTVGGFIHAEPRLKDDTDSNVVVFDEYGSNEKSHISGKDYISYQLKSDINDWCTALDSSAENLVNQLDYASGVSVEPAQSSYGYDPVGISLRTESVTARVEENNETFIPTSLPIYKIKKVVVVRVNGQAVNYDITPYVYEQADYDGLLKSNGGYYPNSKGFAIYYTQGQKNIRGLFYEESDPVSQVFKQYSIVNIIRLASGDMTISIKGNDLKYIAFQITYTPIYSTRIRTIKQTLTTGKLPRAIAYNQGENLIETRYYGENLKGVVARLGNIEKTYTYNLPYLSDIPKVGLLFDDNYYISAVYTEVLQSVIKCTVGLSKDFNRLSQYVGISSNKRMWEVSEKQSQQRQSIYTEYIKASIKDSAASDSTTCLKDIRDFVPSFATTPYEYAPSIAKITTYTKNKTYVAQVVLPVVSSAFGNSAVFTFQFADNYSAGEQLVAASNGVYGQYVPYCDYFGKFYYMNIELYRSAQTLGSEALPGVYNVNTPDSVIGIENWKYRKDNREIPQISYELAGYSDDEDIIIGSAFMQNSQLLQALPLSLKAYGFKKRLNKLSSTVDLTEAEEIFTSAGNFIIPTYDSAKNVGIFSIPINESQREFLSYAIVTEPSTQTIEVTDDDGNVTTQTINIGGMLYIGVNKSYNIVKGKSTLNIYLSIRKEI